MRIRTVFTRIWPVLWIDIGFNVDPEPTFNLNADPYPVQGAKPMWIHADPDADPGLDLYRITIKIHFMGHVNFGQFPCSWIRIRHFQRTLELDSGTRLGGSELYLQKKGLV